MRKLALIALAALASGCVTMNESMLRVPPVQPLSKAVVVETRVGEFTQSRNGEGKNDGVFGNTSLANQVNTLLMGRWKSKDIVAQYGAPGDLKMPPDYTFTLSGNRNEDSSILGAMVSGFTLMLLPSTTTLIYDLKADLADNRTGKHYQAQAKNGVTTVMEILFLPAVPFSWLGSHHAFNDLADVLYEQFRAQGAFPAAH